SATAPPPTRRPPPPPAAGRATRATPDHRGRGSPPARGVARPRRCVRAVGGPPRRADDIVRPSGWTGEWPRSRPGPPGGPPGPPGLGQGQGGGGRRGGGP